MSSVGDEKIKNYLNSVCSLVKNKRVHESIKEELLSHIYEIIEDKISQGKSEEIAIEEAITQMGDYNIVGTKLNKAHKATTDWILLAMMGALILFSLTTFSYIQNNNIFAEEYSYNYAFTTLLCLSIGIGISMVAIKLDYRILKKYSIIIYGIATIIASLSLFVLPSYYGLRMYIMIGLFPINVVALSQGMFIIALAGIFENYNWHSKKNILIGLLIGFMPGVLFLLTPSLINTVIYMFGASIIMIVSGLRIRYLVSFLGTLALAFACSILNQPYRINRLLTLFSFRNFDSNDIVYGYIYKSLNTIRNSSKLFGQGEQIAQNMLPSGNTDFILVYIIYSFGWIVAIMLITLIIGFIIRIGFIGMRTKDKYGKLIVVGFCSIMSVQFLLNILINLNLAPCFSVPMPFISYGGSNLIINIITVALIISIYKWRNTPYTEKKNRRLKETF